MKKTLSMIVILSITLFAEDKLNNQEIKIIQENKQNMVKMDEVDKEIRVIDASIEKKKLSIYKTFKEIEQIVNGYECQKFKMAVNEFRSDVDFPENISKKELIEKKAILMKLEKKLESKCKGK